ncbi:MAG TPA: protein-ADP-ribose hydrolase [Bacteroidales bacterium]|nr:protein-ADP-ribose hydrolase [Bacteroidales bacterium]
MDNLGKLIKELISGQPKFKHISIPEDSEGRQRLFRILMNCRPPVPATKEFLIAQDKVLQGQRDLKGVVSTDMIPSSSHSRLKLWQGDITRLAAEAIVNAANSRMLGCFVPLHGCIDNAIHSAAGIQLRLECNELMKKQGYPEPTGSAKITRGYNLPAKWVIHTVGPVITESRVSDSEKNQLADCYRSCLRLADEYSLQSIAFCCISTGEYSFPNKLAAEIAVNTVIEYFDSVNSTAIETVIFNVFKDLDNSIYSKILKCAK